jgi:transcriptional regulator with XRE-family HTH domain
VPPALPEAANRLVLEVRTFPLKSSPQMLPFSGFLVKGRATRGPLVLLLLTSWQGRLILAPMDESEQRFEEDIARHHDRMGVAATPAQIVGARVREGREARGWTQQRLGEELGRFLGKPWPKQMISGVEIGHRDLSVTELLAFSAVLRQPVQGLLDPGAKSTPGRNPWTQEVQLPAGSIDRTQLRALVVGALDPGTAPIVREVTQVLRRRLSDLERVTRGIGEDVSTLERLRERKEQSE